MTDTFDAVLADVDELARDAAIHYPEADDALHERIRQIRGRLAAAHAAKVAGLEANLRNLSPLNYEERCRLRDAEARIAELTAHAADRESEIETIKFERKRAEDEAEAAERDAGRWLAMREHMVAVDWKPEMGGGPVVMFECMAERVMAGPEGADAIADAAVERAAIATTEQADED